MVNAPFVIHQINFKISHISWAARPINVIASINILPLKMASLWGFREQTKISQLVVEGMPEKMVDSLDKRVTLQKMTIR